MLRADRQASPRRFQSAGEFRARYTRVSPKARIRTFKRWLSRHELDDRLTTRTELSAMLPCALC